MSTDTQNTDQTSSWGEEESDSSRTHRVVTPSMKQISQMIRGARKDAESTLIALLPLEVTEHLVNAQKEFVKAGQRAGQIAIERLDDKILEAREIHQELSEARKNRNKEKVKD